MQGRAQSLAKKLHSSLLPRLPKLTPLLTKHPRELCQGLVQQCWILQRAADTAAADCKSLGQRLQCIKLNSRMDTAVPPPAPLLLEFNTQQTSSSASSLQPWKERSQQQLTAEIAVPSGLQELGMLQGGDTLGKEDLWVWLQAVGEGKRHRTAAGAEEPSEDRQVLQKTWGLTASPWGEERSFLSGSRPKCNKPTKWIIFL